jgi:hypothetical protein
MALTISACKDDDNNLGLNLQPPNDKLNIVYSDTTKVVAYSQLVDSIRSDETSTTLLGSLLDPVFGKTTASFYTQFRLSKSSHSFGDNPVADSLVLTLLYDGSYGDSTAEITLKVHEMAGQIHPDTNYYSNQSVALKQTLLAQKTFVPNYEDSVIVLGDTLIPHLRVNLGQISSELVDRLINIPADSMETNESFLNYFYGLYVSAEPTIFNGQLIYFDLVASLSRMTIYYHNDTEDSLRFDYVINANCARFGHFEHDYSLASQAFKAQVLDKDTALGQATCYAQSLSGVKTFVRFPNIRNYYDNGKIAINEARLFVNCFQSDPDLPVATNLILVQKADSAGYIVTLDQLEGSDYYGGEYDSKKNGYWFRITLTIQDLLQSTDPDNGFEIYLSGGAVNAERVLLSGPDPLLLPQEEDRMKLVITYTEID